jgi:hypothetical protein
MGMPVPGDHFSIFPLIRTGAAMYEAADTLKSAPKRDRRTGHPIQQTRRDSPMAVTPSKDYKRREREQRKLDKRMAREAARAAEAEARQIAAEEAAEESEEEIQARLEAEFEAELEAERKAMMVA